VDSAVGLVVRLAAPLGRPSWTSTSPLVNSRQARADLSAVVTCVIAELPVEVNLDELQ